MTTHGRLLNGRTPTTGRRRLLRGYWSALLVAAATLMLLGRPTPTAAVPIGPLADHLLVKRTEGWYESAVRTMVQRARLAGVRIDTDVDVALTARGHIFSATLEGFEALDLLENPRDGVNVGFVYLSDDAEEVPAGFYVVRLVVNGDASRPPQERDGVAWLISEGSGRFRVPLVIGLDPNPERGPRKGLTTEGGGSFRGIVYYDSDGHCIIILTD